MDGHFFSCVLGGDAALRHACSGGCGGDTRGRLTSLRASAAEGSDGAHEDDEGHEGSHGDADDHRHRERLCRHGDTERERKRETVL